MGSLITSLTRTNPGGGQLNYVRTLPSLTTGTGAASATTAYLHLVRVSRPLRITQMAYGCQTAAGNVDLGIYTTDGTTLTLVASAGPTAAAGSGVAQTINLATPYTMRPDVDYYLAIFTVSASLTLYRQSGNAMNIPKNQMMSKNTGGAALPATATIASMTSGTPCIDLIALV